jgi:hypothetical protein
MNPLKQIEACGQSPWLDYLKCSLIEKGEAAIEEAVPADVTTTALYARFRSRQEYTFGENILSAMRFDFGGHVEGQEPIDPEPKHADSQGHSATKRIGM